MFSKKTVYLRYLHTKTDANVGGQQDSNARTPLIRSNQPESPTNKVGRAFAAKPCKSHIARTVSVVGTNRFVKETAAFGESCGICVPTKV